LSLDNNGSSNSASHGSKRSSNQLSTIVVGCVLGAICLILLTGFVYMCHKYSSSRKHYLRVTTDDLVYNREEEDGPSLLNDIDDDDDRDSRKLLESSDRDDDLLIA
jgi:hypothetical protein